MDRREHEIARTGRLTSSMAATLMSGYPSASRPIRAWNSLLREMRNPRPFFDLGPNTPDPLAWGTIHEEEAAAAFWDRHPEFEIQDPRFVRYHDSSNTLLYKYTGDSPDRMLTRLGETEWVAAVELKCPYQQEIHWGYVKGGVVPREYKAQCFWHMMIPGVPICYFGSYDPRVTDPHHRFFEVVVMQDQDPEYAFEMERRAMEFLEVFESGEEFKAPPTTATSVRSMFS